MGTLYETIDQRNAEKEMRKTILLLLFPIITFSQVKLPSVPQPNQFPNYQNQSFGIPSTTQLPNPMNKFYGTGEQQRINQQNQQIIQEVQKREIEAQKAKQEIYQDIAKQNSNISYSLPSYSILPASKYYYEAYDKLIQIDTTNFSVKNTNFLIENAFYENSQDKAEFDKIIKNSGEFLIAKMQELGYDLNSNAAKNYMLFQFFSETLQLKSNGLKHLPFKYDFEDFQGVNDWSKMFVTKLLATQTGQCHSMPLLYLILAEEINAEAYLAYSPNHSYIRFPDDNRKWHNIELTNGMFSTTSSILNSGYIKSEALSNKIYMQNLSKKELLSHFYVDLAMGYIHKFGYDEFCAKVIDKALELSPNSINANMVKSNIDTNRFETVMFNLKINPRDNKQLQNIRYYPQAVELLKNVNNQYDTVDNLGYEHMPEDAYLQWLQSMQNEKNKQESEKLAKQFKGTLIKPLKN